MRISKLIPAIAFAIGLPSAALAANYDSAGSINMIGIDVTQAGDTDEQRMAFWKSLPADQSATAEQKCREALADGGQLGGDHSSNVYQFCVVGLK